VVDLNLGIIIWRIGGGGPSFLLQWGPENLLASLLAILAFQSCPLASCGRFVYYFIENMDPLIYDATNKEVTESRVTSD
jgi:hypothetical protein